MSTTSSRFRELIRDRCVAMPGVYNGMSARLVEQAGFDALYISGAGLANATAGVPDIGLLTLEEVTRLASYIANAVKIPALIDADTGFGGPSNVARTVREFERVGLAGMHLEDQEFPKRCGHLSGKAVVPANETVEKIRAGVAARRNKDFLILARTDARSVEGFDAAVKRARLYLEAGADGIFPEALESPDEFARFAREVDAPLLANMTEFGKGQLLSVKQLADMGYRMVIFPQTAFRVANHAMAKSLASLKETGTQSEFLDRMQTRNELYKILRYDPTATVWPVE
jgi:methylisocitrate lyase